MAFFDDFSKKITQAGQTTIKKTKDMADIARINSLISDEEQRINDAYFQIGKLYAEQHANDCESAYKELIDGIAGSEQKIQEYKNQIQDIKGVVKCLNCGAEVPTGSAFCASCGAEVPKIQISPANDVRKCTNCGAELAEGSKFCASCGTAVPESTAENTSENTAEYEAVYKLEGNDAED